MHKYKEIASYETWLSRSSFNFLPLKVRNLWRQPGVQTLPRDWRVHMCLQRGQGGGFGCSRHNDHLRSGDGHRRTHIHKQSNSTWKAPTTIRNLPGLRERRFDLRVALFAHRGKRSQRTFPQAARADHGLLGALQRGENVLNCQRLPEIARL